MALVLPCGKHSSKKVDSVVSFVMRRYNTPSSFLKVVLGDHDRTRFERTQISVGVERVIVHPGYIGKRNYWRHDLALLRLDSDVKFTKYIRPICLPWGSCEEDVANCYCTGWGIDGDFRLLDPSTDYWATN